MAASSGSKRNPKKSVMWEKQFEIRNSPLIDRYEHNEDIKTIYNLFAILLIGLLTNTVIHDYTKTGELHFGLRLIIAAFNKFHLVIPIWATIFALACWVYVCFLIWAKIRTSLPPKSTALWDKIWLVLLSFYYFGSLYALQKLIYHIGFSSGSTAVLLMEQIRILMKMHSFVRTNAPTVLSYKPHSDQTLVLPTPQKFFYFSFAPTMIYRNEYPRTKTIRWGFVIYNFMEVIAIVFLLSLNVERFLVPLFEDFGLRKFKISEILIPVVGNTFPGVIFMLGGFYLLLHAFQNAFAEMLRFGDRKFYGEWWTCRSLSEYFRTWNIVVHDWLYTYLYKDMYEIVMPKNRLAAKLTVFSVSAVVHEWLVSSVLRLFLPVQFTQFFLAGAILTLINAVNMPVGNLVVWYCIVLGSGIQVNLYTLEYFARENCPIENATVYDFFKPRILTCDCIE